MQKSETQGNQPPLGYPTENPPAKRKLFSASKKKGERGFIEGCYDELELDQISTIYQKASLLCVAAGFVKNAAELRFWQELN
ncbi:unnamed protein product [Sphenostylis stenocarpa]|uniref:Uncharacterized protein n=1 Tax=Sphenostylis stenocarpa TaxID=92480 RepID=A0AA86S5E4_9FABA|nr:unnamed protein product [Sphenostylis stenocarpa]